MNLKLKHIPLAIVVMAQLACSSPTLQADIKADRHKAMDRTAIAAAAVGANVQPDTTRGSSAYADKLANEQTNMPVLRRAKTAWLGAQMVPVTNDDKLPAIFRQEFTLDFDDKKANRVVTLDTVAARITDLTKVAVRVQPDVGGPGIPTGSSMPIAPAASPGAPLPPIPRTVMTSTAGESSTVLQVGSGNMGALPPVPVGFGSSPTVNTVDMKWRGTLSGFLNRLTDRLGLAWEFRDNTVVIMKYVTEYHEVAAFGGKSTYSMDTGGGSTAQGGGTGTQQDASSKLTVNDSGSTEALDSIEKAVKQMISAIPGSSVTRSDGSGRLMVKTTREMQSQVRDFIKAENRSMLRQAQIQFDIYSVQTDDRDERGVDWNVVLTSLSNVYGLRVASPATLSGTSVGSVAYNILTQAQGNNSDSRRFGGTQAMLNLLNQVGDNVQHRPVSLLALNRTWARKSKLTTDGYLAETTPGPASSTGVGAPGLKTDKITTGDQYVALPQILDNNTVLLKFGVSLSDLLGLFDVTVGAGLTIQKVQVPRTTAVNDQSIIALKPGEVVAITGLSREVSTTDQRTLSESAPIGLGGSRNMSKKREHFVIFVRPVIL